MIRVRDQRLWTALTIVGLCATAINSATPTLRFGLATLSGDPAGLKPLKSENPIGPLAQRALINPGSTPAALTALLSATPLAGDAWLQLAIARQQAGTSLKDVASALAMSTLTTPNEADIMARRALFGLPLWAQLPPDIRHSLIADLVGGWDAIGAEPRKDLDSMLTVETDQTREEIRAALLLAGDAATPILATLDLAPIPGTPLE